MVSLHFNKGVYHYYILGRQNNTYHLLQLETWSICTFNNWKNEGRTSHYIFSTFSHFTFFFIFYQKVEYRQKKLF